MHTVPAASTVDEKTSGSSESDPYASHLPTLRRLIEEHKPLSILEFGCGLYSTPLFCASARTTSIEQTDPAWLITVGKALGGLTAAWSAYFMRTLPPGLANFDLVFIDGDADLRRRDLRAAFRARVPLVVYHDAERPMYGYHKVGMPREYRRTLDTVNGKQTAVCVRTT